MPERVDPVSPSAGVSLLDYFAAAALTGILANARHSETDDEADNTPLIGYQQAAAEAYRYPAAMVQERDK